MLKIDIDSFFDNDDNFTDEYIEDDSYKLFGEALLTNDLSQYTSGKYEIIPLENNQFDVKGDIDLYKVEYLPESFKLIRRIIGEISINEELKSFKYFPSIVEGHFYMSNNKMETLEGFPDVVTGTLCIRSCHNLTSLKGISSSLNNLIVAYCDDLISLDGLPEEIKGSLYVGNNINLESIGRSVKRIGKSCDLSNNRQLENLGNLKYVGGKLILKNTRFDWNDFKMIQSRIETKDSILF